MVIYVQCTATSGMLEIDVIKSCFAVCLRWFMWLACWFQVGIEVTCEDLFSGNCWKVCYAYATFVARHPGGGKVSEFSLVCLVIFVMTPSLCPLS